MARRTEAEPDSWPVLDEDTLVGHGAPPPPPSGYHPPPAPPPDHRLGTGMLLGILTVLLVSAGIALAWFLTHRDSKNQVTTVLVSTPPPTSTTQPQATTTAKAAPVEKAVVPRVTGIPVSDAKTIFDKLGLKTVVKQVAVKQPAGTVVGQAPRAGSKLAKRSYVTLAVAKAKPRQTTTTTPSTTTAPAATTTAPTPAPQPTTATMPASRARPRPRRRNR
jgi:hypothetical protein